MPLPYDDVFPKDRSPSLIDPPRTRVNKLETGGQTRSRRGLPSNRPGLRQGSTVSPTALSKVATRIAPCTCRRAPILLTGQTRLPSPRRTHFIERVKRFQARARRPYPKRPSLSRARCPHFSA